MKELICLPGNKKTEIIDLGLQGLNALGIDYACVRVINLKPLNGAPFTSIGYFSDEEWGKHYEENNYDPYDKISRVVNKFSSLVVPWYTISESGNEKEVSYMREEVFNIKNGFTLVRSDDDFKYVLSLASHKKDSDILSKIGKNKKLIHEYFCHSSAHLLKQYF